MEHHKTPAVYIAFGIIASQIALVYSSIFNHWGLKRGEVESQANMDTNTTLNPSFSTMLASGIIKGAGMGAVRGGILGLKTFNPSIKNCILDRPLSSLGSMIYQPQL